MSITFDFRDWKYLSHFIRFTQAYTDPAIIAGTKDGEILIDFTKMTDADKTKESKYEVGGRLFYEAHAFATGFTSFTTNGFFDREGYVEPLLSTTSVQTPVAATVAVVATLALCGTIYVCTRKPKSLDLDAESIKI